MGALRSDGAISGPSNRFTDLVEGGEQASRRAVRRRFFRALNVCDTPVKKDGRPGLSTSPSTKATPAVLPNQVGDPLLPLQIGIWDAFLALLRPGAEPEALARALRAYTRSTGYFMACARKDAMRHDLDGRAVEQVSEEHRTGALKAVQGRRRRSANSVQF